MDFHAQEQLELERLETLMGIFDRLELAKFDGYLTSNEFNFLRGECGLTEKLNG